MQKADTEVTVTHSATDTERVAAALASRLRAGDVVLLRGDLGSGKTAFVRGACRALGIERPVTSPSFVLGNVYSGDPEVAHLDLYRLDAVELADELSVDDYLTPDRIGFVEWPHDSGSAPPGARVLVTIEHAGGDDRRITVAWLR